MLDEVVVRALFDQAESQVLQPQLVPVHGQDDDGDRGVCDLAGDPDAYGPVVEGQVSMAEGSVNLPPQRALLLQGAQGMVWYGVGESSGEVVQNWC